MAAGSLRHNSATELNVTFQLGLDANIPYTEFISFSFTNEINTPPRGEIVISDINSDFVKTQAGKFGKFYFQGTNESAEFKESVLDVVVGKMVNEKVEGGSSVIRVSWGTGTASQLNKVTRAYTGSSTEALAEVFRNVGLTNIYDFPTDFKNQPDDAMTWRNVQENMWEQLHTILHNSYLKNDYIFWAWDDVNDVFKVSSLGLERSMPTKYIMLESESATGTTDSAKSHLQTPAFDIWEFDHVKKISRFGEAHEYFFPNIAFTGIIGKQLGNTEFRKSNFFEVLRSIGDDKVDELFKFNQIDESILTGEPLTENYSFGEYMIKRHWPNNIHSMYSFAEAYRKYKIAMYTKTVELQIINNLGPPLGSKVVLLKAGDNFKLVGLTLDNIFSDEYVITKKTIDYTSMNATAFGYTQSPGNYITTLTLQSDNFAMTGEAALNALQKQLKAAKK